MKSKQHFIMLRFFFHEENLIKQIPTSLPINDSRTPTQPLLPGAMSGDVPTHSPGRRRTFYKVFYYEGLSWDHMPEISDLCWNKIHFKAIKDHTGTQPSYNNPLPLLRGPFLCYFKATRISCIHLIVHEPHLFPLFIFIGKKEGSLRSQCTFFIFPG